MRYLLLASFLFSLPCMGQQADTLNGFEKKIAGEDINYFSPLHQFAPTALLTRCNGEMPISWEAPAYPGPLQQVTYELLIGHSTGTSSANRNFDISLNGTYLFTIQTPMKQTGHYQISNSNMTDAKFLFLHQQYDVNGDGFGNLYITVPSEKVSQQAIFSIKGKAEDSRDWLMVFQYRKGLKAIAIPTNLVIRKENKRQLNLYLNNPYSGNTAFELHTRGGNFNFVIQYGYNKLSIPAYDPTITGTDTLLCIINHSDSIRYPILLKPIANYVFNIIHHSHNDIGYSNIQPEVEAIQNRNISDAIRWIKQPHRNSEKPYWHIESLWAVENYLKQANPAQAKDFINAVQSGQLVLSANYANILSGNCQPEEQDWVLEYARQLEKKYGFKISNAMITDIPGISRSALQSYVNNDIPYLSLGPNYVASHPDMGDRIGQVLKEQGDKIFYWVPNNQSKKKLLVWTAGLGYSLFHGITDQEKQASWEQRISDYCNDLLEKGYPYDMVQLRYTKNADNGPVDSTLTDFVANWNDRYSTPQLKIASLDQLFRSFENKYKSKIPVLTGEISPYWEDGAYSSALEEMRIRKLVRKTIALEKFARVKNYSNLVRSAFYQLHRNIVMFQEHTWGSWSSISDPESAFTQTQWNYKKAFIDSAAYYYQQLAGMLHYTELQPLKKFTSDAPISDFTVDEKNGGLKTINVSGDNIVSDTSRFKFFEPVYALGINPMVMHECQSVQIEKLEDDASKKVFRTYATLPSMKNLVITYTLQKKEGVLLCHYSFDKLRVKEKESFHIAFPFNFDAPAIEYGTASNHVRYNIDQLPGSNKEFICVEEQVNILSRPLNAKISSPDLCLYEVGNIINENRTNEVKQWKSVNTNTSTLFLYVFNNYWHTNYKAYQEGHIEFDIELSFDHTIK